MMTQLLACAVFCFSRTRTFKNGPPPNFFIFSTDTEKSLLGSELKFSVMGGKKKFDNSGKVCNSELAELAEFQGIPGILNSVTFLL